MPDDRPSPECPKCKLDAAVAAVERLHAEETCEAREAYYALIKPIESMYERSIVALKETRSEAVDPHTEVFRKRCGEISAARDEALKKLGIEES